jgi:hypothetical protein
MLRVSWTRTALGRPGRVRVEVSQVSYAKSGDRDAPTIFGKKFESMMLRVSWTRTALGRPGRVRVEVPQVSYAKSGV